MTRDGEEIKKNFIDNLDLFKYFPFNYLYSDFIMWWESDEIGGMGRLYVETHDIFYGYFDSRTSYKFTTSSLIHQHTMQFYSFFEEHTCIANSNIVMANITNTGHLIQTIPELEIF